MTDVTVLLRDPNRGFRTFLYSEIYLGPGTTGGNVVPNIDDEVIAWVGPNRGTWRVTEVSDGPSYIPTLMRVNLATLNEQVDGSLFLPMYQPSAIELAFIDTTVTPYTISIDDRYTIPDLYATYAKLFRGTDLSSLTGIVISETLDGDGNLTSYNVNLEAVDTSNPAIKRPPVIYTGYQLLDGEVVTLVIYSQAGHVIGTHSFRVINSSAIRGLGMSTVVLNDIVLVTNMLDSTLQDTINVPANVPIAGGDFQARLLYSDGSDSLISVGTSKCKLNGLDKFNTSLAGDISKVVLTYYADVNEPVTNVNNPLNRSISHVYNIRTINNNLNASFKIYIAPYFDSTSNSYYNEYYLTNLDYSIAIKLTSGQINVRLVGGGSLNFSPNSGPQEIVMAVVMSSVIPFGYSGFTFTQSATITYGTTNSIGFIIDYQNTGETAYGLNVVCGYSAIGGMPINVSSNTMSLEQWLLKLYTPLHGIYNQTESLAPPTPTHFKLLYNGLASPVLDVASYWNILIQNYFGIPWTTKSTILLVWLKQDPLDGSNYLTLGVSPMLLKNTLT